MSTIEEFRRSNLEAILTAMPLLEAIATVIPNDRSERNYAKEFFEGNVQPRMTL